MCHERTNGYLHTLIFAKRKCGVSSKMLSPLVSWFLSPSSSSSSSEEEQNLDINTHDHTNHENHQNFNIQDDHNDQYFSSCDVDDTIPVALAVPTASPAVTVAFPADDERSTVPGATTTATTLVTRSKGQCPTNKYVRQYQRLWTKQDEEQLLKGYLDYMKQDGRASTTLQNDVASLYDHVRPKLNVDFNRNQLVEKLRRLKRKHKLALDKGRDKEVPFRNPQEQAIFEISHKIWGNDTDNLLDQDSLEGASGRTPESRYLGGNVKVKIDQLDNSEEIDERVPKRLRLHDDAEDVNRTNEQNNGGSLQGFIEETMRSCFSPLLKEVLDEAPQQPPPELVPIPLPLCPEEVDHEQWRKRGVLELEVYLKRLELLQDQIKARLEELRSR